LAYPKQGVIVAVKKKPAVKKAAVKKSAAKKSVAKKSTAKKAVAKKSVKKSAVKKSAAKKTVKKSAVKKSAAKKSVKKSTAKKRATSASSVVIPPVPSSTSLGASRVDVSSTPKLATTSASAPAKPSTSASAPKQGASGKVLAAIIVGIILLAVVVVTRPDSGSDDAAPAPAATESPMASEEPTAEPSEVPSEEPTAEETSAPVAAVEGPKTIGNWKDAAKSVMTISWKAPAASAGLTGYKVEVRVNRGEWAVKSEVPADQLSIDFSKTDSMGETAFRVSSVYSDGQEAVGNTFGFSGVFE
jgi:hypothetical protein